MGEGGRAMSRRGSLHLDLVHIEIVGGDHPPVVPAAYFPKETIIAGAAEVELAGLARTE
jgi:hypothetical protein